MTLDLVNPVCRAHPDIVVFRPVVEGVYDDEHNQMKNLILLQELMLLSMCRNRLSNKIDRFLP